MSQQQDQSILTQFIVSMTLITIFMVYLIYLVGQFIYERCKKDDHTFNHYQEPSKYEQLREALIERVESMPILQKSPNSFEIEQLCSSDNEDQTRETIDTFALPQRCPCYSENQSLQPINRFENNCAACISEYEETVPFDQLFGQDQPLKIQNKMAETDKPIKFKTFGNSSFIDEQCRSDGFNLSPMVSPKGLKKIGHFFGKLASAKNR